jgi:hypothetical protein
MRPEAPWAIVVDTSREGYQYSRGRRDGGGPRGARCTAHDDGGLFKLVMGPDLDRQHRSRAKSVVERNGPLRELSREGSLSCSCSLAAVVIDLDIA